jgi:predicted metal-dependent hydrolase
MTNYTIIYSKIKHWYVRLMPDLSLKISIPLRKSKDKKFETLLLKKWEQLIEKYKKRNITKIEKITSDSILIFWKKILLNEISENLEIYLKQKLYDFSLPIIKEYSKKLWFSYNKLYIKPLKSKWWSCSWINNISINLYLVHLPIKIIKYVIIHEVCHLKEKNHSKNFYNLVEWFCGDYKEIEKELKNIII